jgi:hypothetical protein
LERPLSAAIASTSWLLFMECFLSIAVTGSGAD